MTVPSGAKQKMYKSFCISPPSPVVNKSKALFLSTLTSAIALSNKAAASSFVPNSSAKDVVTKKLEHTAARMRAFKVFMVPSPIYSGSSIRSA